LKDGQNHRYYTQKKAVHVHRRRQNEDGTHVHCSWCNIYDFGHLSILGRNQVINAFRFARILRLSSLLIGFFSKSFRGSMKKTGKKMQAAAALLLCLFVLGGCGRAEKNAGSSLHLAECEIFAEAEALQASRDKRRLVGSVYRNALRRCTERKKEIAAWEGDARNSTQESDHDEALLELSRGELRAFGRSAPLPEDVSDSRASLARGAPGRSRTLVFTLEDGDFLIVSVQDAGKTSLRKIPYPVPRGMWEYSRDEQRDRRWVLFFGERPRNWAALFGGYIDVSKSRRIIVTAGMDLSYPKSRPEHPLRLAGNQREEIAAFKGRWQEWFLSAFQPAARE
jgi:hypothetical protein